MTSEKTQRKAERFESLEQFVGNSFRGYPSDAPQEERDVMNGLFKNVGIPIFLIGGLGIIDYVRQTAGLSNFSQASYTEPLTYAYAMAEGASMIVKGTAMPIASKVLKGVAKIIDHLPYFGMGMGR